MKVAKMKFVAKRKLNRGKKIVKAAGSIGGAFRAMHRIGAFKEPPRDRLTPYIQTFCRKMANSFGVEVVQVEPVPVVHGLWVSNHVSWMDIPVVGSVGNAFFLSKAEIGEWPVFGSLVKASGNLFIKRGSGDSGGVVNQISEFLNEGHSVSIFPEATTTNGLKIKHVHGKLLQAAINADKPIQPMVVCYANKNGRLNEAVPYYGKQTMKDSLNKVLDCNSAVAYVLPLKKIETNGRTLNDIRDEVQKVMEDGLAELQSRVLSERGMQQLRKGLEKEEAAAAQRALEKEKSKTAKVELKAA